MWQPSLRAEAALPRLWSTRRSRTLSRGRDARSRHSSGPVDILVNAPGVNSSTPFFEIDLDEWHRILDTNLTSVFLACQVFGRAMVERGQGGTIINISSTSSEIPLSRVLTYSVSKAGVNILTRYLARELAPHGIRVNAIVPGFFPAEQNRRLLSEDRVRAILGHTPAARLGEPDELVGTAVWLASGARVGVRDGDAHSCRRRVRRHDDLTWPGEASRLEQERTRRASP